MRGDGRLVEFTRSVYRSDRYDLVAELTLPPEMGHGMESAAG